MPARELDHTAYGAARGAIALPREKICPVDRTSFAIASEISMFINSQVKAGFVIEAQCTQVRLKVLFTVVLASAMAFSGTQAQATRHGIGATCRDGTTSNSSAELQKFYPHACGLGYSDRGCTETTAASLC